MMYSVFISDRPSDGLLLQSAVRFSGLPPETFQVARTADGKPYFPLAPQVQFSISHSGGFWCCAFSKQTVGLDLQLHRPCRKERLSKRFFCQQEDDFLHALAYDDLHFFDLWAAKEAYFKYTGTGLRVGLSSVCLIPPPPGIFLHKLAFLPNYSLCLCSDMQSAAHIAPVIFL